MPIKVKKALEILNEVLAGEKSNRFFQQNVIARDGLQMEPTELNHKLSGRRKFTNADYIRLAHYFDLGEKGHELFKEKDEPTFRAHLQDMGVGKYTNNPTQLLVQKFVTAANQSSSTLELIHISSSYNNRSGLVSSENARLPTGLTLRIGDRVRLRFNFPVTEDDSLWFALFNIHSNSKTVRVLNPIFRESAIQLRSDHLDFPESNSLEIRDAELVGPHRLIAIAGTSFFRSALSDETSRLLTLSNGTNEWVENNRFEGLLDNTAKMNINRASLNGLVHCALLEYRQVQGAQQP